MTTRLRLYVRSIVAPAALVCYGMPLGISLAADLGHGAQHLGSFIEERQWDSAAVGVSHTTERTGPSDPARSSGDEEPGALTHTHAGSTHTHAAALALLIRAADTTGDSGADDVQRIASHAPHVLPASAAAQVAAPVIPPGSHSGGGLHAGWGRAPVPPPPRA